MTGAKTPRVTDYLNGQSPTARGEEKKRSVLLWILRWGYSTADLVRQVTGRQRNGYARKLVRDGLLREVKTEWRPGRFYVLTRAGLEAAVQNSEDDICYPEVDPSRVHVGQMAHYLAAQEKTIKALSLGTIFDYKTERMFSEGKKGEKRPDVIWITLDSTYVGLEVELSAKFGKDLDQFVSRLITSLDDEQPGRTAFLKQVAILAKSDSTLNRYKQAMQPGVKLKIWEKSPPRYVLECRKSIDVPDWLIDRVSFHLFK